MENRNHISLSPQVSQKLKSSIMNALEEEKKTRFQIYTRSVLKATLIAAITGGLLYCFWSASFSKEWLGAFFLIWLLLIVGFSLYEYPQPRLAVRGYWSLWVFAKLLIAMTLISAVQLVICPHFAFMGANSSNPFAIFGSVTEKYMQWGGMNGCMFLCGFTFSLIGSALGFSLVRRHFSFSQKRDLGMVLFIALLSESPIIILQLQNSHSREMLLFWLGGSFIAFALTTFLLKVIGEKTTVA